MLFLFTYKKLMYVIFYKSLVIKSLYFIIKSFVFYNKKVLYFKSVLLFKRKKVKFKKGCFFCGSAIK
jgi:hypothetical protein